MGTGSRVRLTNDAYLSENGLMVNSSGAVRRPGAGQLASGATNSRPSCCGGRGGHSFTCAWAQRCFPPGRTAQIICWTSDELVLVCWDDITMGLTFNGGYNYGRFGHEECVLILPCPSMRDPLCPHRGTSALSSEFHA